MTNHITAIPNRKPNSAPISANHRLAQFKLPILLTLLHLPLGILLYKIGGAAIIHPYTVLFVGLYWAFQKKEKLEKVACVAAYIVGVEVLWRMAGLSVFWEFGKYAAAAIMIVALLRRDCRKIPILPLLYFVLLLPSCILTLTLYDFKYTREMLSFNMSGPFLLFVSCWFFSHLKIDWSQVKTVFFAVIVPLSSVAVTTLFYTATTADIQFNTESNHATSGGYGPNQVSAMLGLGAFLCATGYLIFKNRFQDNLYLGVLTVLFTAQSVMTFSRGGMYNAVGALLIVALFQMRNPSRGIKRLLPIVGIAAIFLILVFPYLNNFTGGKLEERFEESDSTGRVEIVESDFQIFSANPFLGVGVGESAVERGKITAVETASHTEFARIISEHGIFGICSLLTLVLIFIYNLNRQISVEGKAMTAGLVVWSGLFMLNAGMRLAAPSFILGLSFLTITNIQQGRKISPKNLENKTLRNC
jgi:O-Antigen ligase